MATGFQRALSHSHRLFPNGTLLFKPYWLRRQQLVVLRCYGNRPPLFPQRLVLPENHGYVPTLSPQQISSLLQIHETTVDLQTPELYEILSFDSNQLGANFPIEDRRAHAKLLQTPGMLFGMYDGHGGVACAQSIQERLFEYIAVALLSPEKLEEYAHALKTDTPMDLLKWYFNDTDYFNEDMSNMYRTSLQRFMVETLSCSGIDDGDATVVDAMRSAFVRLDNDISVEAHPVGGSLNMEALEVALSGACACVAHINGLNLHVASVGDCRAVIGQYTESGEWVAKPMTVEHSFTNPDEVMRLRSEHPKNESNSIMRNNRLLGQLIPLRAFGDMRYKWTLQELKTVVNILDNEYARSIIPMNYLTPPYLSCIPDVSYHRFTPEDRFVILASDGLWEMLPDDKVVKVVGEFIEGKETQDTFRLPDQESRRLGSINSQLKQRKSGLANRSADSNMSTHCIRHALGFEHRKVSEMLTIPGEVVRYYRDDITVTVVLLNKNYIDKHTSLPDYEYN